MTMLFIKDGSCAPVNPGVRYRLRSQAVFIPGSNGLPEHPVSEVHELTHRRPDDLHRTLTARPEPLPG
jgi:hypothetical protein